MSCDFFAFSGIDNSSLDAFFHKDVLSNRQVTADRLSDQGLRDYLFNLSKQDHFKTLQSEYYSCEHFNQKFSRSKANIELSVFHLNIRSLNSKQHNFVTFMSLLDVDFDVIILSEVWTTNVEFYHNIFDGYSFFSDLPITSSVGGIGFFVKKSLSCKPRTDLNLPKSATFKCENLFFEIIKNKTKYIVGGIYRHPNQAIKEFCDILEPTLSKISKGKTPAFIAGDINIDLIKAEANKVTSDYLNCLIMHSFLPIVLLPTRITDNSATVIDHIYYFEGKNKKKDFTLNSGNLYCDISDHLPNFALLRNYPRHINLDNRPFIRMHTVKNKLAFSNELSSVNWSDIMYNSLNVDNCYNAFVSRLTEMYDKHFPLIRQSRRAYKNKKWISRGLRISSMRKIKLYEKWICTKSDLDKCNYLSYKKVYSKVLRKAQIEYYNNLFDSKINSMKSIWSNLNRVCSINKNKKSCTVINKLLIDGNEIVEPANISKAFNSYFCRVGENLVRDVPIVLSKDYTNFLGLPIRNSIFVENVSAAELLGVIGSLKGNKSCGPDGISSELIKDNANILCDPLLYLFNLSLSQGVVPQQMKIAKIIPIFKKGDVHLTSNYRPISLLSIFNKLLEKLVYKRLYSFLDKHNLIYSYQFGFRKHHSTSMALLEVIDSCYKNLDVNNKVLGIFFDLQKAFDTVNHKILLHKLYHYGIRGSMYNWLQNYLSGRQQFTVVNGISSDLSSITFGVPQGSCLGPLLFLLYINDINNAVDDNKLKLFADDTNLFLFDHNLSSLETRANSCLAKMELWFNVNKLSLNVEKTSYTLFSHRMKKSIDCSLNLFINKQLINKVNCCKYLGVFIDSALKWDDHIDYLYKKLIKFTSIFYKMRDILPRACLYKLYYSFVHPHLLYGIEVYANASKSSLDRLLKLNNKLLRILFNKDFSTPVNELYVSVNILPIPILHEMQLLVLIHKCLFHKKFLPTVFQNYFIENNVLHSHGTRQNADLHIAPAKSNYGLKQTAHRGSKLWNCLPSQLKCFSTIFCFKKQIKTFLISRMQL